ncbi:MAG: tetrahydrofolate synthase, partial [Prevotella salivae]|nr:tetrahydrofolate synthase [Segatella salivae]
RHPHNCFISQLGTSCSFDSPGLARSSPTPGEYSQGDSTP